MFDALHRLNRSVLSFSFPVRVRLIARAPGDVSIAHSKGPNMLFSCCFVGDYSLFFRAGLLSLDVPRPTDDFGHSVRIINVPT